MEDEFPFALLGSYINELMRRFDLKDKDLCDKMKIGHDTFDNIKKR